MKKTILVIVFIIANYSCKDSKSKSIKQIVDKEVSLLMKEPEFSAVSGVIYVDGESYQFHFGELINGKAPNNKTLYEIGSITKTYTGLILSNAIVDKKLNLDDTIENYLDGEYSNLQLENGNPITLRHLITHTSGLPMNINCNKKGQSIEEQIHCFETFSKQDFFKQLKQVKLIANSGINYHYLNAGIQLVGYILEEIYQISFEALLKKFIFFHSKEQNTYVKTNHSFNDRVVIGKNSNGEKMPLEDSGYEYSGGMKSSTASMLQYIKMYLESNTPFIKESMTLLGGNQEYGRAYAWNTFKFNQPNKMLYHNGGTYGSSSWIALYPMNKIGIFLITNVATKDSQGRLNDLSNKIIKNIKIMQSQARLLPIPI